MRRDSAIKDLNITILKLEVESVERGKDPERRLVGRGAGRSLSQQWGCSRYRCWSISPTFQRGGRIDSSGYARCIAIPAAHHYITRSSHQHVLSIYLTGTLDSPLGLALTQSLITRLSFTDSRQGTCCDQGSIDLHLMMTNFCMRTPRLWLFFVPLQASMDSAFLIVQH